MNPFIVIGILFLASVFGGAVTVAYLNEYRGSGIDKRKLHAQWIKEMDAESAKNLLVNAMESDMDVYEYIARVDDESSSMAAAIRGDV